MDLEKEGKCGWQGESGLDKEVWVIRRHFWSL